MSVLLLRPVYAKGTEWPVPFEIIKRRGRVVGIDFIFLAIDSLGAFFSLMSIAAQNTFDPLGGVMYALCLVIEIGIFSSYGVWLWRTRGIRRHMKSEDKAWEEWDEAIEWEERMWQVRNLFGKKVEDKGES